MKKGDLLNAVLVALVGGGLVLTAVLISGRREPPAPIPMVGPPAYGDPFPAFGGAPGGWQVILKEPQESAEALLPLVRPPPGRTEREGIAVAILIDTSKSMKGAVLDPTRAEKRKIDIAKRAARRALEKLSAFGVRRPDRPLHVGLYDFSGDVCRRALPLAPLDLAAAWQALDRMDVSQGTPIGEALLAAKRDLDRSGLTRKHIIAITDGENTRGRSPVAVARAISLLPPEEQAGVYFVAFDVEASRFNAIKKAGGAVLEARDADALDRCLDLVLEQNIILELPEPPAGGRRTYQY